MENYCIITNLIKTGVFMANRCDVCGKGPMFGCTISHAHNVTKKTRYPNLRRVKAVVEKEIKHVYVCSRCLRSGKVKKAV